MFGLSLFCRRSWRPILDAAGEARGTWVANAPVQEDSKMITIRSEARRRGLRMAAHVAALSGVLAAAAAASQAGVAEARGPVGQSAGAGASEDSSSAAGAERLGDLMKVNAGGGCGCAPCWGPPAPPAMRPELFELFAAAGEEVAA
jgi:hypothetical protein